MSLEKTYNPHIYETQIYKQWEDGGLFKPQASSLNKTFAVALPPPNANANLHLGHALDFQIKDIIARHKRLLGYEVLLLPGADHAGFETWAVYEKHLNAKGQSRFDFNRQELYDQVYEFVAKNRSNMEDQIRKLGISCNWQQFTFTLDDKIVEASYKAFKKMWDQGLIYRAKRLVNYCTTHETAFADIEVIHENIQSNLWHIKYPLSNRNEFITVATTRPETMLGDMAVAVHPEDKRYQQLIGQTVNLPLTGRQIPIIADDEIKMDFGTGAVKITPGSDFVDFDIGQRHQLAILEILNTKGRLTTVVPQPYQDLDIKTSRQKVIDDLQQLGLIAKIEDYNHQVGHCYKCHTRLEPLLRDQWFVNMKPLAKTAIQQIEQKEIKFYPAQKAQELITYLKTVQDWNISRQIAWGIPIPVFENINKPNDWIYSQEVSKESIEVDGQTYRRDTDVFDTWWSSGQWAYASLDYENNPQYYPSHLMETGVDILRPWVSRMIVLSLFITGKIPFKEVYLHGMIVDEKGAKMSKSKGNVVNPMDIIDKYGADALRIGIIAGITPAQPQAFGLNKITMGRNFCNKLWNIGRFVQAMTNDTQEHYQTEVECRHIADYYIVGRFNKVRKTINKHIDNYRLNLAWEELYNFIWHDLADWYLEISKIQSNPGLLAYIFENSLRLVHPWAPFVSEVLYKEIYDSNNFLINHLGDDYDIKIDSRKIDEFEYIKSIITQSRQCLELSLRKKAILYIDNKELLTDENLKIIQQLTSIENIESGRPSNNSLLISQSPNSAWLVIEPQLLKSKYQQLNKEIHQKIKSKTNLEQRLANKNYLSKAPNHLIDQSRQQLKQIEIAIDNLQTEIKNLEQVIN